MSLTAPTRRVAATVAALTLVACRTATEPPGVHVRFRNATGWVLTDIRLESPGVTLRAARLAPGERSAYERQDGAYAYGTLSALAGDTVRGATPTDYVGETPLRAGRYTYVLRPRAAGARGLELELEVDR